MTVYRPTPSRGWYPHYRTGLALRRYTTAKLKMIRKEMRETANNVSDARHALRKKYLSKAREGKWFTLQMFNGKLFRY